MGPLGCKVRKMGGTCRQVLLLLFAMGITAILGSEAEMTSANTACTTAQNTVKTDTAQAGLDCGTNKCGKVTGNEQQACLCKNCKTQDQAAQSASCACGMSDANSAAACQIYQCREALTWALALEYGKSVCNNYSPDAASL